MPVELENAIDPDILYTVSKFLSKRLEGCRMSKLRSTLIEIAEQEPDEMSRLLRTLAAHEEEAPEVNQSL